MGTQSLYMHAICNVRNSLHMRKLMDTVEYITEQERTPYESPDAHTDLVSAVFISLFILVH